MNNLRQLIEQNIDMEYVIISNDYYNKCSMDIFDLFKPEYVTPKFDQTIYDKSIAIDTNIRNILTANALREIQFEMDLNIIKWVDIFGTNGKNVIQIGKYKDWQIWLDKGQKDDILFYTKEDFLKKYFCELLDR